jgi:hypothetical protein
MDTLDYTGHISTTSGPNDMIKRPLESQDQLRYLTLPMLSIILTPSGATSQPLQNCQTLQWFLSPLYVSGAPHKSVPIRLNVYEEELSLIGTNFGSPEV